TSAMSGVTNELVAAARRATSGEWDPAIRERLFERHEAVARAVTRGDDTALAATMERVGMHLDRFEKLCFGLSLVHELTPRLLDAISGTGELLSAPILAAAIAARGVA